MSRALVLFVLLSPSLQEDEASRLEREKKHDAAQRPLQLRLVTASFDKVGLEAALADITRQTGINFAQRIHPTATVTLLVKNVSLQQVYDAIEDQLDVQFVQKRDLTEVHDRKPNRRPRAYAPGMVFELTAKNVSIDDAIRGVSIRAGVMGPGRSYLTEWEVSDSDGKALPLERCEACGPLLVFAKRGEGRLRVRLRGKFQWDSVYSLEVADPGARQVFRVSQYTVTYEFPNVKITSAGEIPYHEFPSASLVGLLKDPKGRPAGTKGVYDTITDPGRWCYCPKGPKPVVVPAPATRTSNTFSKFDYRDRAPSDFASMKIVFRRPFQEPFDTEVVIPAD